MKHLLLVLLAVFVLPACQEEQHRITDQPALERSINLEEIEIGAEEFNFSINKGSVRRTIRVERRGEALVADIRQPLGPPLVEVSVEFNGNTLIVTETTGHASLRIERTESRDRIQEKFVQDDRGLVVSYPKLDAATMARQYADYAGGNLELVDSELLIAFEAFEEFYVPDASLHGNEDGDLLVEAIRSQELREATQSPAALAKTPVGPQLSCKKCLTYWCAGVGVVTSIKCLFGGPANLLCDVGGIVSLACAMFEIWCGIFEC